MAERHAIIIGGSVAGLGACIALAEQGFRVTVLEADATPLPESPQAAVERWDRKGAPQARQSHALLARLRNLIREHAPGLLDVLLEAGATELHFRDRLHQLFPEAGAEPGDEEIVFLACRRIVFEYVLRRWVQAMERVEFRDGVEVAGLCSERDEVTGLPRVTGVRTRCAQGAAELAADVVVDASGRRSQLVHWLRAIGTPEVREERSPCGIFYTTRFYRLREGAAPPALDGGITGVDLGYLKVGIFAGDSDAFSITLAASPGDDAMRRVLHEREFEIAAAAVPRSSEWVKPEMSEPISDVAGMAKLENLRRFFVEDGRPLALGVFAIGDAVIHTNPITGRGCSLGWVGAFELAEALASHPDDLVASAVAFEEALEREVVPWYRLQRAQDADSIEVAELQQQGLDPYRLVREDGTNDPKAFMRSVARDGLRPALAENPQVLRIFMRLLNLLDSPDNVMRNPVVMKAAIDAYSRRDEREPVDQGPARDEMVALLGQAG